MGPARKMTSFLRTLGLAAPVDNTDANALKARSDGFSTAKATDALFPRTTADVDGEDCLHDCESCTIKYPRKFEVETSDALYGEIKGWSRHLIVATGKTDWVRDVEDEQESVMQAVGKHINAVTGGRLMLSASNIPVPDVEGNHIGPYGADRPTTALLLPSFVFVEGLTPAKVPEFFTSVLNSASTNTTALESPAVAAQPNVTDLTLPVSIPTQPIPPTPSSLPAGITLRPCPHKYLILLCSQATRDARCGQSAPLLRRELERHLRPLGLFRDLGDERPGGCGIYFISHVGGHKYSANMMIYRRADDGAEGEAAQCMWLARIRPEDCENLVKYTLLQGKLVKPDSQLRGGFDRARGIVSW